MKKTYICPNSVMVNLIAENMIAASAQLTVNPNEEAEQWSNHKSGWDCESWSTEEEDF